LALANDFQGARCNWQALHPLNRSDLAPTQ